MPGVKDTYKTLVSLRMYCLDAYITWNRMALFTDAGTIYEVAEDKNSAAVL
jgi:hypothetical protein